MSLMGSLHVGTSGLQNSQNALNTTAHNLSNIDTTGYTRQQVQLASKAYITISTNPNSVANQQYGLGVSYSRVKQIRDDFLDKTYRKEAGRSMFYEVTTETLEEVESLLGELNGEAFQTTMTDLWTAVQELAKDPSSAITQGLLVQRSNEFILRAQEVYDGLCSYQNNMNLQVKQQVDKINKYGEQLVAINEAIAGIESGGVERANDLRDTRNMILDELATLAKINYSEDSYGNVSVQIEGVDFVKGGNCYEIALKTDEKTGFYTPFWPQNATFHLDSAGNRVYNIDGAEVFDLSLEISSDLDTDIGGLKGLLYARGDHRADYSDITAENYDTVSQSSVMLIQAEFDQLIHNVASKVNSILAEAAGVTTGTVTLEDGTVLNNVKYCKSDPEGYMRKEDGSPIQMFSKVTTDGYQKMTNDQGEEIWVYMEEDFEQTDTLYTLKNLQVDKELAQKPSMLGFKKEDGSVDNETAEALKKAFTEEVYTLNPKVQKQTTFVDYYTDMVSQVANNGYIYRNIYENQVATVESTENARQQVVGVSSDEELSNMIKFQNAYNASSRYINVISELLEHVITTLGR